MEKSSPNEPNDFCSIDSETREEIVTGLRNIYSNLTKGSDFTCTDHHDGCPANNGNVENDARQYVYVGNEVFSYDCLCNLGGIRKKDRKFLQTLNGGEAIPVGVMRNYVKPTVMSLKTEVGPSRDGHVCPCIRCHQVSSIGCRYKGCMVEDDYLACSTERYYQCEGLSVKISNASCCLCDRGKQTYEENGASLEGRKPVNEQASDLISKLNNIEKKIISTNVNVTHDNDYFSALLNELSQLIDSFKEGDRNIINTIETLKLKLMSLEKGLKCVFKDSECFQEDDEEKQILHSTSSFRDEMDLKPKKENNIGTSSILIDSENEDRPLADRPPKIRRDAATQSITEADKPADIIRHYDGSISETVTPAEISQEFDSQIDGISETRTPAEISHEFDARREGIIEAGTPAEISHEFDDARMKTISDAKKTADIPYDANTKNIRETVTPTEIKHQFDARTGSGSIREAVKPAVSSTQEFGTQTESNRPADRKALTPSGSRHRFHTQKKNNFDSVAPKKNIIKSDMQIKSSDYKTSERNTHQADGNAINKTTGKYKTDTSAKHIPQINEHITNGLKTDTGRKLKTMATTANKGSQADNFVEIEEDAPDEKVHQIYEKMGKIFERDKPAEGIPQTNIDTSRTDTSAETKYKFDIEAESCNQDDDRHQNLTDNIQIDGEKECCFKVKIKKIKILGETSTFKEYNKIKPKSVDFVESLNDSNKTKQTTKETPIPSINKVSEEPTIFSDIEEPARAGKLTAGKSVFSARSNGIEKHKKKSESSKKKMAKSIGRPKESGKELLSKHKFETSKKKKKSFSKPEGKYDLPKHLLTDTGRKIKTKQQKTMATTADKDSQTNNFVEIEEEHSLDAKQNELSIKAKANNENGVKINSQKLPLVHSKKTKLTKDNRENNLTKSTIVKNGSNIKSLKNGRLGSVGPKEYVQQKSKHKFETSKKKNVHFDNESKYDFPKSVSLDAKQNELSIKAKANYENGVKINSQKLPLVHSKKTKLTKDNRENNLTKSTIVKNGSNIKSLKNGRLGSVGPKEYVQQKSKHKFETSKKKNVHFDNESKYDFPKSVSLDAKQNELSIKAKANYENGVKINSQKLPLVHSKKTKLTKDNRENNLTKSTIVKNGSNIKSLKNGRLRSPDPKEYVQQNSKAGETKSTLNLDAARETRQNDLLDRRIYWENKHFKRTSEPNHHVSSERDCNQYELINQQDYCEIKNMDEKTNTQLCDCNQENKLMNTQVCCEVRNVKEASEASGSVCYNQVSEAKERKLSPVSNGNGGNGQSCCSEVHPCCNCSLGEGHHCHINQGTQNETDDDDDLEAELDKLPAWCRNNYIPDICTQADVTKEIFVGRSKKKCCYPAPCPASCLDHLPKEEWLDVMPPRLYVLQPRKTYPC